jgi:hypothetical protein
MTLQIIATVVLLYFFATAVRNTLAAWAGPYHGFWAIVSGAVAASLFIPLWAVWS